MKLFLMGERCEGTIQGIEGIQEFIKVATGLPLIEN
jgi:hypothetical protein